MHRVLFCSFIEADLIAKLRDHFPQVCFEYYPELLAKPRYIADHVGEPIKRTCAQDEQWQELLASATILFDFDYHGIAEFKVCAKSAQWVQASSAGIGQFVLKYSLHEMPAIFTTAAGIHARPLAEFVLWSMLAFSRRYITARKQQQQRLWQRFCGDDLEGRTLAIVGLGEIGRETARLASLMGMRVVGSKRTTQGVNPEKLGVQKLFDKDHLTDMLSQADYVCLASPHTPETDGMIGEAELRVMKPEAVLINIGRGALVQEAPLLCALNQGWIRGAVLDVAPVEPLPSEHPLWQMENVIIFPHSASTSVNENKRLVQLFIDNLERFLSGQQLKNVFDVSRLY
jgi:glyoxylate/hydroxypyruvate reductase A